MEWHRIKSLSSPRPVKELTPFKNETISIDKNIKFRKVRNHFEDQLRQDLKRMKSSNETMTFGYKTTNIYRLIKEEHDKILNDSKAINNIKKKINATGKQALRNNKVLKRMQTNVENNCFISLKDHKENFQNNSTV